VVWKRGAKRRGVPVRNSQRLILHDSSPFVRRFARLVHPQQARFDNPKFAFCVLRCKDLRHLFDPGRLVSVAIQIESAQSYHWLTPIVAARLTIG